MNLFTKTEIGENPVKIHHHQKILTLGSCFAENIGQKLAENKFQTLCNPFGIIYNPIALSSCIERMQENNLTTTEELQLCQDYYCHLDFHSQFNGIDKHATLAGINEAIMSAHDFISEGIDWLLVSLGTSYAYRDHASEQIVNNCHKIPASNFERSLLSTDKMTESLLYSIKDLKTQNPELNVILTVSPIRHIKDGLSANLRSKSRLIETAHLLTEKIQDCYYFPSYEMLIEELRDYRWYASDLIHPNDMAIYYIWQQFENSMIADESKVLIKKIEAIHKNLQHKAFLKDSSQYKLFLDKTEEKILQLESENPLLDFDKEKANLDLKRTGK